MTDFAYLMHRAAKLRKPTRLELTLLDRDLEDAGIAIPWGVGVCADPVTQALITVVMRATLSAA